ncbi:MAG: DUF1553 domain-containing protein [Planctomycetales bacterium]|nr:DUF1553 domain-containing protein [Planctomycetales bacterium]
MSNRTDRRLSLQTWRAAWTIAMCVSGAAIAAEPLDFGRDILPILSDACFHCHGPDENQRASEFHLDNKLAAFDPQFGAIVPGKPDASPLIRRIESTDPEQQMPPPSAARRLTAEESARLRQWIREGAAWQEHWAFVAPQRPALPSTRRRDWRRNAVDDFVLAELESRGWRPSAEASKETLIRRVSLDLTGLPPSIEELDRFLNDDAPDAYERLVERLLSSPRYGERMAILWLDAARYADTSGYQNDGPREMWRYRDWVIEAFNRHLPFDEFTIEQIAGDLLADAPRAADYESAWRGELIADAQRLGHLIPSAFHRNHRGNAEGGIIPAEYQAEYVVDRVDTTATVWLGLTLGCCRCHDHKFDPFKQREFYELFAFFNNVPEYGRAIKEGNSPPFIRAPNDRQRERLGVLASERDAAVERWETLLDSAEFRAEYERWRKSQSESPARSAVDSPVVVSDGLIARFALQGNLQDECREEAKVTLRAALGQEPTPAANPAADPKPHWLDGPAGLSNASPAARSLELTGDWHLDAGDFANFGYFEPLTLSAWVYPTKEHGTIVSRMTPGPRNDGYYLHLENRRVQLNLVKRWLDDSLRVETEQSLPLNQWTHVVATYDGSREANGVRIYLNGVSTPFQVHQHFINQTFAAADQPVRLGDGAAPLTGRLADVRIYDRALSADEARIVAERPGLTQLAIAEQPSEAAKLKLRRAFLANGAPPHVRAAATAARDAQRAYDDFVRKLPTLMVMQELERPRETHVLIRGEYDKPGERVEPRVPRALPPLPESAPRDRLTLAKWLVDPSNPLTARVLVNRLWQLHFGAGLVRTAEDFGVQGSRPSHPQLLDYLATEIVRQKWSIQAIQRLIVTSAAYRQQSAATAEQLAADPENRWLARGPRHRLPAELVRDQALAASGLLRHRLGGPSVMPYQPEGLWKEIATDTEYRQSHGDDLYRRSLYTYWKRTVSPPTMMTFDAVSRESCIVSRSRTNTPLQALALMNEVSFVEAARALAERAMAAGDSDEQRIVFACRAVLARRPTRPEQAALTKAIEAYRREFREPGANAEALLQQGELPLSPKTDARELAAFTMLCSLILNLDEAVTKE